MTEKQYNDRSAFNRPDQLCDIIVFVRAVFNIECCRNKTKTSSQLDHKRLETDASTYKCSKQRNVDVMLLTRSAGKRVRETSQVLVLL